MKTVRWLILVLILSALGAISPPGLYGSGRATTEPIFPWVSTPPRPPQARQVDPIANRYLAFGDSITCTPACTDMTFLSSASEGDPYPTKLEQTLDVRVAQSEVINAGLSGEGTLGGSERITGKVTTYRPQYVLILEGTNDVTRGKEPVEVRANLQTMIDNARQTAGVSGVEVMLATIIPRTDDLNDETEQMNALAVHPAAQSRGVPVCDLWGAMIRLPNWPSLLEPDGKHPNDTGRAFIAHTFYDCMLTFFPGVNEETVPPVAWIESLPPTTPCGQPVTLPVTWAGSDDLSWVVDYDVRARLGAGEWLEWLMGTPDTAATFTSDSRAYGNRFYFQVRARDLVGNVGPYSDPVYSQVTDSVPPYEAHVNPLPPAVTAPFPVSWSGADACTEVTAFGVQYRAETDLDWRTWLSPTLGLSASFNPVTPAYGSRYRFRVRPRDEAGNWGAWSTTEASTVLARWTLAGQVLNPRGQPVTAATVSLDPDALHVASQPGGRFLAYLVAGGSYDVLVARADRYGPLPPMVDVDVATDVSGLSFILPPPDDAVVDGGFEAGDLSAWQVGGSVALTLTTAAHTGFGAVRLDGAGQNASIAQELTPPGRETATLSFLARLEPSAAPTTLRVELSNDKALPPPAVYTRTIDSAAWTHVWYDLAGLPAGPFTLTFRLSGTSAILLDEIALGSSPPGTYPIHLPVLTRN